MTTPGAWGRSGSFDVERAAVVGPIISISAERHEAGFVSVGAFAGRALVAWEQEQGLPGRFVSLSSPAHTVSQIAAAALSAQPATFPDSL